MRTKHPWQSGAGEWVAFINKPFPTGINKPLPAGAVTKYENVREYTYLPSEPHRGDVTTESLAHALRYNTRKEALSDAKNHWPNRPFWRRVHTRKAADLQGNHPGIDAPSLSEVDWTCPDQTSTGSHSK